MPLKPKKAIRCRLNIEPKFLMTDTQTAQRDSLPALRDQLLQLQKLHDTGALEATAYASSKAALERRLVDAVLAAPATATTLAPASKAAPPVPRTPAGLWAGLGVFARVVAGAASTASTSRRSSAALLLA